MREIAVIGAGAAGLVASRHLVACGLRPTIFEIGHGVGGAWRTTDGDCEAGSDAGLPVTTTFSKDDFSWDEPLPTGSSTTMLRMPSNSVMKRTKTGKMWDHMTTNLSKFTCRFSDHPWPETVSLFPSAMDVSQYMRDYSDRFLDPQMFRYGCYVTNISKRSNANQYTVTWKTLSTELPSNVNQISSTQTDDKNENVQDFDGVVVATGFFSQPFLPKGLKKDSKQTTDRKVDSETCIMDDGSAFEGQILHSSDYRSPDQFAGQTVAVVGSSFSALEIAADICQHMTDTSSNTEKPTRIISIIPSIPWVLPRYVVTEQSTTVLPLDLALYRRSSNSSSDSNNQQHQNGCDVLGTPYPEKFEMTSKDCYNRHLFLRELLGPRRIQLQQEAIGIPFDPTSYRHEDVENGVVRLKPPHVSISDIYLDLVLEGRIEVIHGRAIQAQSDYSLCIDTSCHNHDTTSSEMEHPKYDKVLDGIDSIIACTGYSTNLNDLLESNILDVLDYDPNDNFAPMTACYDTYHPKLPGLGFVGMYKGPYFGVMELQARVLADLWSKDKHDLGQCEKALTNDEIDAEALAVSRMIRRGSNGDVLRPQFPHFDYVGFMDTLAQRINLPPLPFPKNRLVVPPLYQSNQDIVRQCEEELERDVFKPGTDGSMIPKVVLGALIGGTWEFDRTITHFSGGLAQQHVSGVVRFSRKTTPSGSNKNGGASYVRYREDGEFVLPNGKSLSVFREYDYLDANGNLELYFIEGGERAHLFLSLKFAQRQLPWESQNNAENKSNVWVATSDHLCIKDLYKGTFEVTLEGLSARDICMTYRVRGPTKDYESVTMLRPSNG